MVLGGTPIFPATSRMVSPAPSLSRDSSAAKSCRVLTWPGSARPSRREPSLATHTSIGRIAAGPGRLGHGGNKGRLYGLVRAIPARLARGTGAAVLAGNMAEHAGRCRVTWEEQLRWTWRASSESGRCGPSCAIDQSRLQMLVSQVDVADRVRTDQRFRISEVIDHPAGQSGDAPDASCPSAGTEPDPQVKLVALAQRLDGVAGVKRPTGWSGHGDAEFV